MTWLQILGIVVLVTVGATLAFVRPKGARDAAGTRMMGAARIVLVVIVVIVGLAFFL